MTAVTNTATHLSLSAHWAHAARFLASCTDHVLHRAPRDWAPVLDRQSPASNNVAEVPMGFDDPDAPIDDDGADYWLKPKAVVRFSDPQGYNFTCITGALWLTVDDETTDRLLAPGETFHSSGSAAVMVSALQAARFNVRPDA
ncbi:MAG: hypothetical protein RIQ60_56 [Pseudomonadota bacterium]|jgi:hypothetical protein